MIVRDLKVSLKIKMNSYSGLDSPFIINLHTKPVSKESLEVYIIETSWYASSVDVQLIYGLNYLLLKMWVLRDFTNLPSNSKSKQ